jgi:hypothetical protein
MLLKPNLSSVEYSHYSKEKKREMATIIEKLEEVNSKLNDSGKWKKNKKNKNTGPLSSRINLKASNSKSNLYLPNISVGLPPAKRVL